MTVVHYSVFFRELPKEKRECSLPFLVFQFKIFAFVPDDITAVLETDFIN
jgi:hypothetical protein